MAIRPFGEVDGRTVEEVTIRSAAGAEARVIGWGAVLRDLVVPLATGEPQRVVLGLERLEDYVAHSPHMGAIAGRVANRIAGGRFTVDGRGYDVPRNQDGRHALHGGGRGFGKRPWQVSHHDGASVALTLVSPDGDAGFPGTLTVTCLYRLCEPATLRIELAAVTDAPTPVNLCHHSYFNLDGTPSILDHRLTVAADFYTPTDADLIPTGEIRAVEGTPYDFRANRTVRFPDAETGAPVRYDVNFVLRRDRTEPAAGGGPALAHAATLASTRSNLAMETWTTEPGLQVYDGGKVAIPVPGLGGARYGANAGICLEAQHFPDSPNRAHFPTTLLRPGEVYRQVTEYRFLGM
ncbi:aldose epimerase family protein [Chelatococcus sp. SYSU_G07232]|uniref:Aldose 1-epimerase n=1 Tax=Chelatococcus albus TaxID=3047466 RepID=A0ABT7AHZ4_9HYPH|nr:aldose epimerase family protein [Chelatococcus sp. SYSU_G07232]MDJ1159002.1 aldose epimerase family protein [Chelatococcus sp. SYSU_G07232]